MSKIKTMKTFINFYLKRLSVLLVMMMVSGVVLGQLSTNLNDDADDDGNNPDFFHVNYDSNSFTIEFKHTSSDPLFLRNLSINTEYNTLVNIEVIGFSKKDFNYSPYNPFGGGFYTVPNNNSLILKFNFENPIGLIPPGSAVGSLGIPYSLGFKYGSTISYDNPSQSHYFELQDSDGVFGGGSSSFNGRILNNNKSKQTFDSYPNPFKDEIFIQFNAIENQNSEIILMNNQGQVVKIFNQQLSLGENNIVIDTVSLDKGIYFISFLANGKIFTKRVLKF